jgi:hypothetical protein
LWKSIKEIIVTSKDDIQSRIAIEKAKRVTDSDSYKQLILQYDREISFAQDLLSEEAYKDLLLNDTKDSINRH